MNRSGNKRGESPASLNNLRKPLPANYQTVVVRVSGPSSVIRWLKNLKADERGRILQQARTLGLDGSIVTEKDVEQPLPTAVVV